MGAPIQYVMARLQEVLDALANPIDPEAGCPLSLRPCRVALYPGDTVAYDTCQADSCTDGDGQLWANIVTIVNRTANAAGGSCVEWLITANVGIVRCGPMPEASAEEIQAAADQQAMDADEILNALTCCPDLPEAARDLFHPVSWTAISEQGGCYGGQWTVSGVISSCCE